MILPAFDGGEAEVFGVEDAGGAGVVEALVAGDLDDAAFGGEVALEDDEAAGGLERIRPCADDGLVGRLDGGGGFFEERLAADGGHVVELATLSRGVRRERGSRRHPGSPWRRTCRRGRGRR